MTRAAIDLVTHLVDDVMNGGDLDRLDELCDPQLRDAFTQFQSGGRP